MKKVRFIWASDGNAILVKENINNRRAMKFMLDTGASHTCIDSNALSIVGLRLSKPIDRVLVETAKVLFPPMFI